jgi:hypothetical protein
MKEYWYIDRRTGEWVCSNQLIDNPGYEFMFETEVDESSLEEDKVFSYTSERKFNMAKLVVDILDRKHRVTFGQLYSELLSYMDKAGSKIESRLRRILSRLESEGVIFRVGEYYYRLNLREFVIRRHGEILDRKKMAIILGIPFGSIESLIKLAISRGWLKAISGIETYQFPTRIWKIMKEKSWMGKSEASGEGRVTAVVYTTSLDFWPEDKLENIVTGFLKRKSIRSLRVINEIIRDISSANYGVTQSFTRWEVNVSTLPEGLSLDEVDLKIWKPEDKAETYFIHYVRKAWGWEFIDWRILPED